MAERELALAGFEATSSVVRLRVVDSRAKRVLDVSVAAVALLLLLPALAAITVLIVLHSGWPPLYSQDRVGLSGARFRLLKFRTMVRGAHELREQLMAANEAPFPAFKLRQDPRVTRLGRLLRRSSLDELPQLVNVLRGEMSLVGPRPPLPEEVEHYDEFARQRLNVRPGLTCTWQLRHRRSRDIDFSEWVRLDVEYAEQWTFFTDIRMIGSTILAVFRMDGS